MRMVERHPAKLQRGNIVEWLGWWLWSHPAWVLLPPHLHTDFLGAFAFVMWLLSPCLSFLAWHVVIARIGLTELLWGLNECHIKALRIDSVTWWAWYKCLLLLLFFIIQNGTSPLQKGIMILPGWLSPTHGAWLLGCITVLLSAAVTSKILAELGYYVSN